MTDRIQKNAPAAKHEWKKEEKYLYQPKKTPELVDVPELGFYVLEGEGNPNSAAFADCIEALYAASYGVRMAHKGKTVPPGYFEYIVYPLEGVWDLTEAGRAKMMADPSLTIVQLKDELAFRLMIRQPEFLTAELAESLLAQTIQKKKLPLLSQIRFERQTEGHCVQMLHEGSYDDEPASFAQMEAYCEAAGIKRLEKTHREIYISDARKVKPEALKTVLRFKVK